MSGEGRPESAAPEAPGLKVGIVATEWNADIVDVLLDQALDLCRRAGTREPTVVRVPGAIELAVVAAQLATDHDAVVALGTVIRGGTPHFEYVCDAVTAGLTRVALDAGVPVGNGVLTCDTREQAVARSGAEGAIENKGAEAAAAALSTALVLRKLRSPAVGIGFGRS